MRVFKSIILTIIISFAISANAAQSSCPEHFAGGMPPTLTNPKMSTKYHELCNNGYAVGYSGLTRTPLWGAEILTRGKLVQGRGLKRSNDFQADNRLPRSERSELKDYARSGYDRGHVVPSADFADPASQNESFLLSNMIPQDPDNNRGLHEGIESAVRKEAKRRGAIYVVSGPLFQGGDLLSLKGRVIIPTGIFKCIYDAVRQEAGCYIEANAPGTQYNIASVAEVEQSAGIDLFPAMPPQAKNRAMKLPAPKLRIRR